MNFFLVSSKTIFLPHITIPGHVAQKSVSLIDNIFINNYKGKCLFWQHNNRYLVSNHHPQFLVIKNFYEVNVNDNQISKESLKIIIQMNLKKTLYHLNSRYRKTIVSMPFGNLLQLDWKTSVETKSYHRNTKLYQS